MKRPFPKAFPCAAAAALTLLVGCVAPARVPSAPERCFALLHSYAVDPEQRPPDLDRQRAEVPEFLVLTQASASRRDRVLPRPGQEYVARAYYRTGQPTSLFRNWIPFSGDSVLVATPHTPDGLALRLMDWGQSLTGEVIKISGPDHPWKSAPARGNIYASAISCEQLASRPGDIWPWK